MRKLLHTSLLAILVLAAAACSENRVDGTDGGGVLLTISDFDGLPVSVSVNLAGNFVQVESLEIESIVKDPDATATSNLMTVELRSYRVEYVRKDAGTRTPPTLTQAILGNVPANGTNTVNNLVIVAPEQFLNEPLQDLFFANGGFDKETGNQNISLELRLQFFGRTISGQNVSTQVVGFQIDFTP